MREASPPTPEQVAGLLAENIIFNRPALIRASDRSVAETSGSADN